MGKGNYNGTTAEMVMYWTTESGFDVDITEFIRDSEESYDPKFRSKCYKSRATVTFKDYSYELVTSHFNINILVDDIKNHLIEIKHPDFAYKIDAYDKLTKYYFDELNPYFGYDVKSGITVYNPVKDEYTTRYEIVTNDNQFRYYHVYYTHKGDPSTYKKGDILKFIKSKCKKDLYRCAYKHDGFAKKVEKIAKKYLATNRIEVKDTLYSISNDHFIQPIIIGTVEKEFICKDKASVSNKDIKSFLKREAIEYTI